MEISDKKTVKLHYKGTLSDGSVFDSSEGKEPLEFIYGVGMIIPGLEEGIVGMKVGDKKSVSIPAEKAYGPKMQEAMQEVPRESMPGEIELKVGMQLAAQGPQGVIPVTIAEIKDDVVIIDFNHPLAGKDLTFDVEVVDVLETDKEKLAMLDNHNHGGGCGTGSCGSGEKKEGKDGCCGGGCHN